MEPGLILLSATIALFLLVVRWKVHAFLALVVVAIAVGVVSPAVPFSAAVAEAAGALGDVAGRIAIAIVSAAIIGQCLTESGGADKIVRRLNANLGGRVQSFPLVVSGYVLAIPVFFDTVFYLLIPLARAMSLRRGDRNFVLNALAISAGGSATHVFVPPTPGPLIMSATLGADLGVVMLVGLLVATPASLAGWAYAVWIDRRLGLPIRQNPGVDLTAIRAQARRPESELPSLWLALLPIVLPVVLIAGRTISQTFLEESTATRILVLLGDPNLSLLLAAGAALILLGWQKRAGLSQMTKSVESAVLAAGVIILITAAGGAFGRMLVIAGIDQTLKDWGDAFGLPILVLAFLLASLFKIAQGSGTVAMITVSAIVAPLLLATPPPFHAAYVVAAIGAGTLVGTWMNDSGFWVFRTMTGFDELETLQTKSAMMAIMGAVGFLVVLVASSMMPLQR